MVSRITKVCLHLLFVGACLALSLFSAACWVQAQFRIDRWTTDNGLPQNSVYGITQTRDGYLWLATADGLVRFDGQRFTVFDQSNSKGLKSNRFINLHQDLEGALWAGTEDGGLTRYRNGEFTSFTTVDGLPDNYVARVQDDPEGGLLIMTFKGWAHYRNGRFSADPNAGNWPNSQIHLGPSGSRWTFDKLGLRQSKNGQQTKYPVSLRPDQEINTLFEDRDGFLWVSFVGSEVLRAKDGVVTYYTTKNGLPAVRLMPVIYQDREGSIWFGTEDAGLLRFKDGHFTTTMAGELTGRALSMFEDREGTFWVGTTTGGLNRVMSQFIRAYSVKDGLISNLAYPVFEDRSGSIWIGTLMGLSRLSNGVFTNYDRKQPLPGMLEDTQVLFEDREGRLWISDTGELIYLKDGKVTSPQEIKGKFAGAVAIHQDREGSLWFGTRTGLFKLKDGVVTSYTTKDGLPGDDVKVIHEDRRGHLWIGTYGGLARMEAAPDGSAPAFTSFTTKDGLGSNRVRAIREDGDGVLWIGTYDGGLSRLKDGRITTFTMSQGLFNNGVFQILEDRRGNLWISCNRGIYQVSKQQLNDFADGKTAAFTYIAYGKQDGMLNTECNGGRQPAGIKTRDGKLWFPTMGGVVVIDPEAVPFNKQPPPVLIEAAMLDRNPIAFGAGVQVNPGQSTLEINYTGLSFIKPEQVRFRYKLDGQDNTWVEAGTRRSVNYSYLAPGKYTFTVIAANSDGVWNNVGASIRITVLPPIWRTWWFISLSILTIVGLVLFIYWRRISQFRREQILRETFSQRLIESQEGERKRIAAELHDSLSQNLVIIKNRALHSLTTPSDHERAMEQIEEIAEAANQSLSEVREIAHNLRPFQIDRLGLTKAIDAMVHKVAGTQTVVATAQLDVIDGLLSAEMEIHLYRVVQESLNNIIKHAAATEAQVIIRQTEQGIEVIVRDNGKGFNPGNVRPGESSNGGGFGLLGLSERVRILKGVWAIDSAPGKGTVMTIKLPCESK